MEFNQFNLYTMNAGIKVSAELDIVDKYRQDLIKMNEYDEVKNYLTSMFGDISGEKWIDYPELNKKVYMILDENKIEFCALKNKQQYFGKGWKLISDKK